jgi:hypothetical protein
MSKGLLFKGAGLGKRTTLFKGRCPTEHEPDFLFTSPSGSESLHMRQQEGEGALAFQGGERFSILESLF